MFIYVDESGSFVQSGAPDRWNVVAAYVVPEADRRRVELVLRDLKVELGHAHTDEVKLKNFSEAQIKGLLKKLCRLDSTLFISGIDLGLEQSGDIMAHQANQAEDVRANAPRMIYDEGRAAMEDLASRVERLPLQLYTQFVVQIDVLDQVFRATTLYYSQRIPATLGSFRWRMDEKNSARPIFEETIKHMAPAILQSKSLKEPGVFVEGFDYRHYDREFRSGLDHIPRYLQEQVDGEIKLASNLGKILSDLLFVRSHDVPGVQVADLLASTYRRVLRGEFQDNYGIARMLGALTVQRAKQYPSINLITLSDERVASGAAREVALIARDAARPMLNRAGAQLHREHAGR